MHPDSPILDGSTDFHLGFGFDEKQGFPVAIGKKDYLYPKTSKYWHISSSFFSIFLFENVFSGISSYLAAGSSHLSLVGPHFINCITPFTR